MGLVYFMTKIEKQRKSFPGRHCLRTDTLDSSTPLRCAQNDSDRVALTSMKCGRLSDANHYLSAAGGEIQRGGSAVT